ncbi:MAG: DegT/DnrJ/EryC1/StrS family aminotransferase [Candidatus Omnitrophica bacterium]|nr:DegT/DnrJ/EryC1/StrS family aminotransferase [Candidatus Omnitrophota bacterium]
MKRMKFPLIKPYLVRKDIQEVTKVLDSGWLTQGKFVEKVEKSLKKDNRVKFAFLLNSATSGLIAGIKALGLERKDEIIIPSFTFPATANSVILGGAKPVFCDIDLETFNLSPEKITALITPQTKAIMPVHEFGLSADMGKIMKIARQHDLFVIEDAACSLGAGYKGKRTGILGDLGVFSFHPRKIVTSGEGGCLITNSSEIAKKIGCLRNHGEYNRKFITYGYNFRMSDIQAAVLYPQLMRINIIVKKRISLALNYNKFLKPLEDKSILKTPVCPQGYKHVYQSYVILLSEKIDRDKLKKFLRAKGVETQFGTHCVPLTDFYKKYFDIPKNSYKNSRYAYEHTLALPLYHTLKMKEQEIIVRELEKSIKKCAR